MKKTWKWIVGILLVLIVVGALVAVPLTMRSYMLANNTNNPGYLGNNWNNGPMMGGNNGWQHPQVPGMQGQFDNRSGAGRGFNHGFDRFSDRYSPFGFGFMLIGGFLRLIPLALFGLLLFGVYQLGKRSGLRANLAPATIAPQPTPAPRQPAEPSGTGPDNSDGPVV